MRPWKLMVVMNDSGDRINLQAAVVRYAVLMLTWLSLGMTFWYLITRDTGHFLFFLSSAIPALSLAVMLLSRERAALHDLASATGVFKITQAAD